MAALDWLRDLARTLAAKGVSRDLFSVKGVVAAGRAFGGVNQRRNRHKTRNRA